MPRLRWPIALATHPAVALLVLVLAPPSAAQPAYDTTTVRTISGAVVRVDTVAERERAGSAVRLLLSTRAETLAVHVGPVWYLAAQPVRLAPGDSITVRGSRTSLDGAPLLVAAQVRKGATVLTLRDPSGAPLWGRPEDEQGAGVGTGTPAERRSFGMSRTSSSRARPRRGEMATGSDHAATEGG